MLAFALRILLQLVITWLSVRSSLVRRLAKSDPALLVYHGRFRHDTMRRERVPEAEVRAAVRRKGIASVEAVDAVVLETDGSFSTAFIIRTSLPFEEAVIGGVLAIECLRIPYIAC